MVSNRWNGGGLGRDVAISLITASTSTETDPELELFMVGSISMRWRIHFCERRFPSWREDQPNRQTDMTRVNTLIASCFVFSTFFGANCEKSPRPLTNDMEETQTLPTW